MPYKQGSLDGLCGPYAVVNAVSRLAPEADASELMAILVHSLDRKRMLGRSFTHGVDRNQMSHLILTAQHYCEDVLGAQMMAFRPYWSRRPASPRAFLKLSRNLLHECGCVMIVGFDHPVGGHWSVVTRIDDFTLKCADSEGQATLDPTRITITGSRRPGKIHIQTGCSTYLAMETRE